jgi:hypothetical protein
MNCLYAITGRSGPYFVGAVQSSTTRVIMGTTGILWRLLVFMVLVVDLGVTGFDRSSGDRRRVYVAPLERRYFALLLVV